MSEGQNHIGIFLYFPENEYTEVAKSLRHWQPGPDWGEIRGLQASPQIISKLRDSKKINCPRSGILWKNGLGELINGTDGRSQSPAVEYSQGS